MLQENFTAYQQQAFSRALAATAGAPEDLVVIESIAQVCLHVCSACCPP